MALRWQLADVLRTVPHCTTSENLCGYCPRIEDLVWDREDRGGDATISAMTDLVFVNFSHGY